MYELLEHILLNIQHHEQHACQEVIVPLMERAHALYDQQGIYLQFREQHLHRVEQFDLQEKQSTYLLSYIWTPWSAGNYQSGFGATSCNQWSSGYYSSSGASACTQCSPGTYSSTSGVSSWTPWSSGTYSSSLGSTSCNNCGVGYYSSSGASSWIQCSPGRYSSSTTSSSWSLWNAGSYSNSGASVCISCLAGTFSNSGDPSCTSCLAGSYSGSGASYCTSCSAGSYSSSGAPSCTSCLAGSYSSSSGASSWSLCTAGTFSTSGATSCNQCSAGTYSNAGSSSWPQCAAGTYSSSGSSSCTPCSPGYYSNSGAPSCTQCPSNTYASSAGSASWTNWAFGMFSNPGSTSWYAVWGDGMKASIENWDDHNLSDGDGWNSSWVIESGYVWHESPSTSPSVWNTVWGDWKRAGSEAWDDWNLNSGDGWDSLCVIETGFQCTGGTPTTPDVWQDIWGDGIVVSKTGSNCDDGNVIGGDGWSSTCEIEKGWDWTGGSISSPDHCSTIWGDGVFTIQYEQWDDGNRINGDGWNIYWQIESNCAWSTDFSAPINSIWSEIWGDGKNMGLNPCDDGNTKSGDGCSSSWTIEAGFICSGGSPTKKDIWTEKWGDGLDLHKNEWEDGNHDDGDGWSSICELEKCYEWKGGNLIIVDTCSKLFITSAVKSVSSSNTVEIEFTHVMNKTEITLDDLSVSISYQYTISISWNAYYSDNQTLLININSHIVLTGEEKITIKFINYRVWRGPYGGCLTTDQLSTTTQNSLADSVAAANSISSLTQYSSYIGIAVTVTLVLIGGGSLEMIWALLNTLQLISYLPLMTPFFPEPVRVMFEVLKFTNMNFDFLSEIFYKMTSLSMLSTPQYSNLFTQNGIDTPLFLLNCASILLTLLGYILLFALSITLFYIAR